ncbi:BTB/POZ and MATH domain-containing protein 1-like [Panicum virgatum]|uniref:BTB/POZ and MATH domain-containing protein 1-like n=1 Tax=Panicum virgatum TaxID=38727 RepID=UPI0019D625EE|nr:BTB/POZ and MATH domain-containing protein 1-like [Panicum virgatum]
MQDSVGKFVEISIPCGGGPAAAAAAEVVSKEIAFDDHAWTVHCYPRGAPGEAGAGAGGHLSIHLVNHTNARNAKVLFEAIVLRRAAPVEVGGGAPARDNHHTSSVFEYPPEGSRRFSWPRVASARDVQERCAVGGYATVVCGLAVLRHNPVPAPPSTFAADVVGFLEARKKFGDPDASFAVGGKTFDVVRKVLAARSPVLKAELEGGATTASTFCALLLYLYCDRLPRGTECGCPVTMDLVRDLLAAADWYGLDRLKLLCARKLWDDLSVATVSKTLWYADRYRCPELKSLCIDFLAVGDNFKNALGRGGLRLADEELAADGPRPRDLDELRRRSSSCSSSGSVSNKRKARD